jgi:GTP-binding protein
MGLVPSDVEMANMLRVSGKPIYWVVNKIDSASKESLALEFYRIGTSKLFPISAINGLGYSTLMAHIETHIPPSVTSEQNAEHFVDMPKIAVVGRPNVGKSTLINAMLGKKRHIVSPIAGTTRDPIDSICTYYRKPYLFIDTAGIRKKMGSFAKTLKSKEPSGRLDEAAVERLSLIRAVKSIERADIAVIVLDATQGIVEQDQKVAGIVEEFGKSVIVLFNKWDLVTNPEDRYKELREDLEDSFWFLRRVPFLTVSGLNRQRISKLFPLIDTVIADRAKHIQTAKLNKFLERILSAKPFPSYRGREIKFYYIAQTGTNPPAFNLVVNYPQAIKPQHFSYIEKSLSDEFGFLVTPLLIYAKSR